MRRRRDMHALAATAGGGRSTAGSMGQRLLKVGALGSLALPSAGDRDPNQIEIMKENVMERFFCSCGAFF